MLTRVVTCDGLVFYSPYFGQILSAWERAKTDENVLFLFYEDLKKVSDSTWGKRRRDLVMK